MTKKEIVTKIVLSNQEALNNLAAMVVNDPELVVKQVALRQGYEIAKLGKSIGDDVGEPEMSGLSDYWTQELTNQLTKAGIQSESDAAKYFGWGIECGSCGKYSKWANSEGDCPECGSGNWVYGYIDDPVPGMISSIFGEGD